MSLERVVLTTGGTGGHIFPALAVAEELKRRNPDADVMFVGGEHGREREFAKRAGLRFVGLPAHGVVGGGWRSAGAVLWLVKSLCRAWMLMYREKPQVVCGFGGYAGFAPVLAAKIRGVPCAIHEQNCLPGFSNRVLSRWAGRIMLSLPDVNSLFNPAKVVLTGNPVRREIAALAASAGARETDRRILVVGGSQGARAINEKVMESLAGLNEAGFTLWHQTGEADLERVSKAYGELDWDGRTPRVEAFIDDMAQAYEWADLALCRAGATTVAELAVAGVPSLLIPYPHATHAHQIINARFLEDAGAASVLMQELLPELDLSQVLAGLFSGPGRLENMARAAIEQGKPGAAANVVDELEKLGLAGPGRRAARGPQRP